MLSQHQKKSHGSAGSSASCPNIESYSVGDLQAQFGNHRLLRSIQPRIRILNEETQTETSVLSEETQTETSVLSEETQQTETELNFEQVEDCIIDDLENLSKTTSKEEQKKLCCLMASKLIKYGKRVISYIFSKRHAGTDAFISGVATIISNIFFSADAVFFGQVAATVTAAYTIITTFRSMYQAFEQLKNETPKMATDGLAIFLAILYCLGFVTCIYCVISGATLSTLAPWVSGIFLSVPGILIPWVPNLSKYLRYLSGIPRNRNSSSNEYNYTAIPME